MGRMESGGQTERKTRLWMIFVCRGVILAAQGCVVCCHAEGGRGSSGAKAMSFSHLFFLLVSELSGKLVKVVTTKMNTPFSNKCFA